jgi:hypothetical protein
VPLGSPAMALETGHRAGDRRRPYGEDGVEDLLVPGHDAGGRRAAAARVRSGPDLRAAPAAPGNAGNTRGTSVTKE